MADNNILFPNIGGAPGGAPLTKGPAQAPEPKIAPQDLPQGKDSGVSFKETLSSFKSQDSVPAKTQTLDSLESSLAKAPLKFSAHATSRMQSRGIDMSAEQMRKLSEAVDKAASKGLDDTLVLTKDAAFIVSVKNRTVVTAMDRTQLEGNVFTNIEGAVVMT